MITEERERERERDNSSDCGRHFHVVFGCSYCYRIRKTLGGLTVWSSFSPIFVVYSLPSFALSILNVNAQEQGWSRADALNSWRCLPYPLWCLWLSLSLSTATSKNVFHSFPYFIIYFPFCALRWILGRRCCLSSTVASSRAKHLTRRGCCLFLVCIDRKKRRCFSFATIAATPDLFGYSGGTSHCGRFVTRWR